MIKSFKKAFTLAEIVVAVAIIGILSALTLPTLLTNSIAINNQYVDGLKKTYSGLLYTTERIKANNSGVFTGAWVNDATVDDNLRNLYSSGLKIIKVCDQADAKTGCWSADYYKFDGTANSLDLSSYSMAVLNDGTFLVFHSLSTACTDTSVAGNIGCGEIYIDVNGAKSPNRFGKDIFLFYISSNKIVPNGEVGTAGAAFVCPANGGLECAAKILNDGRMLY